VLGKKRMKIPKNVTAEHVRTALERLNRGDKPKIKKRVKHKGVYQEVVHNGKVYDPRAVVKFALDAALGGGAKLSNYGKDVIPFLQRMGFEIAQKSDSNDKVVQVTPDSDLGRLADKLLLGRDYFIEIERLLVDKGQAIFYGPPGTGKTFVA